MRLLGLTAAGHRLQRAVQADIRAGEEELLAATPPGDRQAFLRALAAISRA